VLPTVLLALLLLIGAVASVGRKQLLELENKQENVISAAYPL